uniref:Uncharacterized protein n=1 Tax=Heterorhabditis bacteriophora TaxID=37862 RepID=A0A1I7WL00_HETBA
MSVELHTDYSASVIFLCTLRLFYLHVNHGSLFLLYICYFKLIEYDVDSIYIYKII